jgi:hypothetical protein
LPFSSTAKIPIKNIEENNFKGKHAARAAFFAICARLLPIDLQLFYCFAGVLTANN